MPLEDDFCDIVRKARFGHDLAVAEVARMTGISALRLQALEAGQMPAAAEVERLAAALSLRAVQLRAIATGGAQPPAPTAIPGFAVHAVFAEDVGAFAYAVRSDAGSLLIDCGGGVRELLAALGAAPDGVLLTHGHRDHVAGLRDLPRGVPVFAHPELCRYVPGLEPLRDGEEVLGLEVVYAPGHSPEMLAFVGPGLAFVGDTVFAGSLGRADSPASYESLLRSARRILALPPETWLFCGHGPVSQVGWDREHNAFPVEAPTW
jgi:glyoxylase-like metal-dependent hydrolase (beta-lactamase superfamily II)